MLDIDFQFKNTTKVAHEIRLVSTRLPRNIRSAMIGSMSTLERTIIPLTPKGYPGSPDKLVESYQNRIEGNAADVITGTFYSSAPGAKVGAIEMGRSSGSMPPVSALLPWVAWKFGGGPDAAFAVARKIGSRNQPGVKMFEKTVEAATPKIMSTFDLAVERSLR